MTEQSDGRQSHRRTIIKGMFLGCVALILACGLYIHGA